MSDHTPNSQDTPPEASQNDAIDQSRRKLTGAALGVSAIFTLASRPVWANQCTVSGMASGNLSAPDGASCEGCTPGYWKVCQHLDSWSGFQTTDTFNSVFGVTQYVDCKGTPYTLLDVMYLNGGSYACGLESTGTVSFLGSGQGQGQGQEKEKVQGNGSNQDAHPGGAPADCTNGNAFGNMGGDPISENLGFHAVAALLSAAHPRVNYGYTPGEIIDLFKNNYMTNPQALKDTFAMLNKRGCPLN
ncbi:hypothetical protein [Thiobacillus denitrificans]|uniref:Uncharacterized protein n=1 Tax=Thiobacillus denitrificans TaxID=36861 RepID=A0A106BQH3_THIDE|nr:hypothetical protein [Thiobacillus denitrificans]KVW96756.1 hypothetical protein ABW22_07375 [Thiobacillus denitrificans]